MGAPYTRLYRWKRSDASANREATGAQVQAAEREGR